MVKSDSTARAPDEDPLPPQYPYAAALGVLRYISDCTRPDVAFITGALARHTRDPALRHWKALQYVARYLNATKTEGLYYDGSQRTLEAFADADFADCRDTRQATQATCCTMLAHPSHGARDVSRLSGPVPAPWSTYLIAKPESTLPGSARCSWT